jgi:hypothetical protein
MTTAISAEKNKTRSVVLATNFIKNYGLIEFKRLLKDFVSNVDGITIATRMGVTRQRVHQWRQAFVKKQVIIIDEVAALAE